MERGAELLCGGREPEGEAYERVYGFLPTVLRPPDHKMKANARGDLQTGAAGVVQEP